MLYLLEADVEIQVRGIAGAFKETRANLVNGNSLNEAKQKFEQFVKQSVNNMGPDKVSFKYTKIAPELK